MVLEPPEDGEALDALGLGQHLPHRRRSDSLHGLDVEQTHALVRFSVGAGEAPPDHLEAGAHGEHHRPALDAPRQGPVVDQGARGPNLWPVLATTEAIDVRLGKWAVRSRVQQLGIVAPPLGPANQDQPVPPVPVGAQQVGVDDRHAERPAHSGASRRSWNAV